MSNRRKPGPVNPVAEHLRQSDGARWPGGCGSCNAVTEVTAPAGGHPNVVLLTVRHDLDCPLYLEMLARGEATFQPPQSPL
jgi:hypothetical protein